ncbi:MAG: hypothetical protein WC637_00035 [Victivallales bacterium]|jgi:hypothetical protein
MRTRISIAIAALFLFISTEALALPFARVGIRPETATQRNRIIADGGTIIDLNFTNTFIRRTKELGIYTSCKFLGDANMAYKQGATGVTTFYDKSGTGNDLVQGTAINQPTWTAGQQNGRAGIVFDGSRWVAKTLVAAVDMPFTIISVSKVTTFEDYGIVYAATGSAGPQLFSFVAPSLSLSDGSTVATGITTTQYDLITTEWNGATSKLAVNGAAYSNVNVGTNHSSATALSIGAYTTPAYGLKGGVTSLFLFSGSLTTAQKVAMENLVNSYYQIY